MIFIWEIAVPTLIGKVKFKDDGIVKDTDMIKTNKAETLVFICLGNGAGGIADITNKAAPIVLA